MSESINSAREKSANENIYHCCVQRTASQWLKTIFSDEMVRKKTGLEVYTPGVDYIISEENRRELAHPFPRGRIISPLYVRHEDFAKMAKPEKHRAFFVMRDPRDLIVSRYFSARYSHTIMNKQQDSDRKMLENMRADEGIMCFIERIQTRHHNVYFPLADWHGKNSDPNLLVVRYEDLTGKSTVLAFQQLFDHLQVEMDKDEILSLLGKYSFEKLSRGRKQGVEDVSSHYRQGIPSGWVAHLKKQHKQKLKESIGQLLIDLGYAQDFNW